MALTRTQGTTIDGALGTSRGIDVPHFAFTTILQICS